MRETYSVAQISHVTKSAGPETLARAKGAPDHWLNRRRSRQCRALRDRGRTFEGTPLDIALRDCGIQSFLIAGLAREIGIEPTVRHGVDLGYIPIVVTDACGAGHEEAGRRALDSLRFLGDAILTDL
ncbi:MAG TPA: isochorismatase family protein, partial [Burkholderiaceae bacterium]|nr:isochorismatase family protein [Burkholderiaceae bacterium]